MSFINWGSESPEIAAIRRRLEEQALYEQAARMRQAKNRAGNAVTGSGGDPLTGLYGMSFEGLMYQLDKSEANWPFNYLPFPNFASFALNTDDGFLYAAMEFEGTVYFIRIDRKTREFTFIDNNISDFATKGTSSLYYEGNGSFIYLDNFFKGTISSIIRITLDELSPGEYATATEVSEVDENETGYYLRNLFPYDGAIWATASAGPDLLIGPFDIEAGSFIYNNLLLPKPEETNIIELSAVFSTTVHNGALYSDMLWYDGDTFYFGLFKIDTVTGGALAPYYASFVKSLDNISDTTSSISSIVHF